MNHQPYEDWILAGSAIDSEQRATLQQHLATCSHCHQLQKRWQAASRQILAEGLAIPAAGFTQRWQASLPVRTTRQQTLLARRFLSIIIGLALLTLLTWGIIWFVNATPADIVSPLIKIGVNSFVFYQNFKQFILPTLFSIPPAFYFVGLSMASTVVLAWMAVWIIAIWYFAFRQHNFKETAQERG